MFFFSQSSSILFECMCCGLNFFDVTCDVTGDLTVLESFYSESNKSEHYRWEAQWNRCLKPYWRSCGVQPLFTESFSCCDCFNRSKRTLVMYQMTSTGTWMLLSRSNYIKMLCMSSKETVFSLSLEWDYRKVWVLNKSPAWLFLYHSLRVKLQGGTCTVQLPITSLHFIY